MKPRRRALGDADLATSLLLVFPLLLAYDVGLLIAPGTNGVDLLSRLLFAAAGSARGYLFLHLVLLAVYVVALVRLGRRFDPARFGAVAVEAAIYALTMGTFILFVMQRILHLDRWGLAVGGRSPLSAVVISLGAGVHEELVFRLGIFACGAAALEGLGLKRSVALVWAGLVSSVLFSAAHHLGPAGEPFRVDAFVYRALAGAIFATIFHYRSLAHAVYTHALYDIYVLLVVARQQ